LQVVVVVDGGIMVVVVGAAEWEHIPEWRYQRIAIL
jgi:hypothetical protein